MDVDLRDVQTLKKQGPLLGYPGRKTVSYISIKN